MDSVRNRTIGWCLGNRDAKTFGKFFEKIDVHDKITYYTDDWDVYGKIIPEVRHVVGKEHTISIEQNNSNVRHYLGRMTRRTKVVSRSMLMIDLSLRIHWFLNEADGYEKFQKLFHLSIY